MSIDPLWPSKALEEAVNKIKSKKPDDKDYQKYSVEGKILGDKEEKRRFAKIFLPVVNTVGYELKNEVRKINWGGTQYDLVASSDGKKRVLQLLMIWTEQRSFVTTVYSVVLALIAILGVVIFSSVKENSRNWAEVSVIIVSTYLITVGIINIYYYYKYNLFSHRITLLFVGFAYLIVSVFDFDEKFDGGGYQWIITETNTEIYLPKISILLVILLILRFFLIVLEKLKLTNIPIIKSFFSIHSMDYAPIWVYLEKINEKEDSIPENWRIEKVYYDRSHYTVGSWTPQPEEYKLRPRFEIRNTWHSINEAKRKNSIILPVKCLLTLLLLELIILSLVFGLSTFYLWGQTFLIIFQTAIFVILIISIYLFNGELVHQLTEYEIIKDKSGKYQLSSEKIEILWNLTNVESRLKIVDKITQPFADNWKSNVWD
ncbi:MAG: hypothetical protein HeimC3_32310 [Candidatus Heimdallarchaeota archaeon LC_3]|nr:MAG: hypothetical protein HeimC3_32310 [Candidatus Heimdallarchaeota archaeon LC_3]